MNKEKLIVGIEEAFSSRVYPGDENICLTRFSLPSYEGNEIYKLLEGKYWKEVTEEYLLNNYNIGLLNALPAFLTRDGFMFYLPSLLVVIIGDFDRWQGLCQSLCFYLEDKGNGGRRLFEINDLSKTEKIVFCKVLNYFSSKYGGDESRFNPARTVLDMYCLNGCGCD